MQDNEKEPINEKEVLKDVADAVTESAYKLTVDILPQNKLEAFLQRLGIRPKQRTYEIKPIKLGSMIRISKLLLTIPEDALDRDRLLASNYEVMAKHGQALAEIVAIALCNSKEKIPAGLPAFILRNFDASELMGALTVVIRSMNITSFMTSIVSVRGLQVLTTEPSL